MRLLVAGSSVPWVEVIAVAYDAKEVVTSDYQAVECEVDYLHVVSVEEVMRQEGGFDAVVSFSSIEHDGLGRYGDPLDPRGDFAARRPPYRRAPSRSPCRVVRRPPWPSRRGLRRHTPDAARDSLRASTRAPLHASTHARPRPRPCARCCLMRVRAVPQAMSEFELLLKPGGLLFLGVPVGEASGALFGNQHRIYGRERFAALTARWDLLDTVQTQPLFPTRGLWSGDTWKNQPIFVLRRPLAA